MRASLRRSETDLAGPPQPQAETPLKRTRWRVWPFVVAVTLGLLLFGGLTLRSRADSLQASLLGELHAGQQDLADGKASLKRASSEHSVTVADQAANQFASARTHFLRTRQITADSRLVEVGRHLPLVGPRVDAVDNVASMGTAVADAGIRVAHVDGLISRPATGGGVTTLVSVLRNVEPTLAQIRNDLARATAAAQRVDPTVLPEADRATFRDTKTTLASTTGVVEELQRFSPVLVDLLGGNGPRTYLVEQVNPSELRSGGGFLGSVSIIKIDQGKLNLTVSGDVTAFEGPRVPKGSPGYIAPPHAMDWFYQTKSWYLRDSNFYPDFATNARSAQSFLESQRHVTVDGVIALDYYAVASMLDVTGPLTLPEYGVTFTSKNFIPELLRRDLAYPEHKSILAAAAGPLLTHIAALPIDRWISLIGTMNAAVSSRHIQAYITDPAAETEMQRLGWSGDLNPAHTTDYVMETEDNYGGTKTNQFVSRQFTITLSRNGTILHHKILLDVRDKPPAQRIHWGNHYAFYLRFYVPGSATNLSLAPLAGNFRTKIPAWSPNPDVPPGYKLADGWVYIDDVPLGQSGQAQLTLEYDTPWTTDGQGDHVLYFQKQPGTDGTQVKVIWTADGQSFQASTDLNQDRSFRLTPRGIDVQPGQVATTRLPGLTL